MVDEKKVGRKPVVGAGSGTKEASPMKIVKVKKEDPKIAKIFVHAVGGQVGDEGRNDCGYEERFKYEDTSRIFGWSIEGEGMCDYPGYCPRFQEGKCPFQLEKRERIKWQEKSQ